MFWRVLTSDTSKYVLPVSCKRHQYTIFTGVAPPIPKIQNGGRHEQPNNDRSPHLLRLAGGRRGIRGDIRWLRQRLYVQRLRRIAAAGSSAARSPIASVPVALRSPA